MESLGFRVVFYAFLQLTSVPSYHQNTLVPSFLQDAIASFSVCRVLLWQRVCLPKAGSILRFYMRPSGPQDYAMGRVPASNFCRHAALLDDGLMTDLPVAHN